MVSVLSPLGINPAESQALSHPVVLLEDPTPHQRVGCLPTFGTANGRIS